MVSFDPLICIGFLTVKASVNTVTNLLTLQLLVRNLGGQVLNTFSMSTTFNFNEWTYCGVSFYKTNRIGEKFEIHLVTKSKSGVQNSISFNQQILGFECTNPIEIFNVEDSFFLGAENKVIILIGLNPLYCGNF